MPRLMLLRHCKSAWSEPQIADIDRPLTPRGHKAAAAMADFIAGRGMLPERILCSPARRTRETMMALIPFLPNNAGIEIAPGLYDPSAGDYRGVIADHGNDAADLMVIGHNPAIQATTLVLIGDGDADLTSEVAGKYPTGAMAVLEFAISDWTELAPHSGRLTAFVKPRGLPDTGETGD